MSTDARHWTISIDGRPLSLNAERRMDRHQRADYVKQTRFTAKVLARMAKIPELDAIELVVVPVFPNRSGLPDAAAGNLLPALKAALDGLVDAKVIPDDTDRHVKGVTFRPTQVVAGQGPKLLVRVHEAVA